MPRQPGRSPGVGTTEHTKGVTRAPVNPTGRLVGTHIGARNGGVDISHWCPDAIRSGVTGWQCPDCGQWFEWDGESWVLSDG